MTVALRIGRCRCGSVLCAITAPVINCDPFDSYIAADNQQYRNGQDEAGSDRDRKLFSSRGQWHLINMVRRKIWRS